MRKKVYYTDFGCRLNQFETRVLENFDNNIVSVDRAEDADVIVINTCTVTGRADMKNRQAIRKSRLLNPDAEIIVTGCYASTDADSIKKLDSGIVVVENQLKFTIPGLILGQKIPSDIGLFPESRQSLLKNSRAFLKIQDGCNKKCSYCKIPAARGTAVSRTVKSTIHEVQCLLDAGYSEIILTGVNIGHYSSGNYSFNQLLRELLKIPGDHFYRISSIEPECINNEFLEIINHPKFARFLHIPLQSGSNKILGLMRRGYNTQKYAAKIESIRGAIPEIHIGTDIMAGFPGETNEDYLESRNFQESMQFSNVHFFPYSQRPGSEIDKQLSEKNPDIFAVNGAVIRQRIQDLMTLQEGISRKYIDQTAGMPFKAIVESISSDRIKIVTENYVRGEISKIRDYSRGEKIRVVYDKNGNFSIRD